MKVIEKLINKQNLEIEEIEAVMEEIMTGKLNEIQMAGFLVALESKGLTIDEIAGCAAVMRKHASSLDLDPSLVYVDTCGTGGDGMGTFNISTTVAFVLAGCGVAVAKHGNRAASSQSGSADILQELGVNIELKPEQVKQCIEKIGIGFIFAPIFHPAMKNVSAVRKALGVRTVFNILGPLTNPASPKHQVVGVFDERLTEIIAKVLSKLGVVRALVVHGSDGMDEITTTGKTKITELINGETKTYHVLPEEFKLKSVELKALTGGEKHKNSRITLNILKGVKGPKRDIVVLNTAAALIAADQASDFRDGIEKARKSIDSGKALEKLEQLKTFSNSF